MLTLLRATLLIDEWPRTIQQYDGVSSHSYYAVAADVIRHTLMRLFRHAFRHCHAAITAAADIFRCCRHYAYFRASVASSERRFADYYAGFAFAMMLYAISRHYAYLRHAPCFSCLMRCFIR